MSLPPAAAFTKELQLRGILMPQHVAGTLREGAEYKKTPTAIHVESLVDFSSTVLFRGAATDVNLTATRAKLQL